MVCQPLQKWQQDSVGVLLRRDSFPLLDRSGVCPAVDGEKLAYGALDRYGFCVGGEDSPPPHPEVFHEILGFVISTTEVPVWLFNIYGRYSPGDRPHWWGSIGSQTRVERGHDKGCAVRWESVLALVQLLGSSAHCNYVEE